MIVVTAATGNIGKSLVENLLSQKVKVRALARDPQKLKALQDQGAETRVVDLTQQESVTNAFDGASAVFTLIPPKYDSPHFRDYYAQVGTVYAKALAQAGVKYVVNLSSVGAHLSAGTGPVTGLHEQEKRLNALPGVNIVHLRPGYFMENMFFSFGLIKSQGINGSPVKPDAKISMIATKDIAGVAAKYLTARNFTGQIVHELLGPRDLTLTEATQIIGQAIGKPSLPYIQFPYEEAHKAMVSMGLSADVATLFNEMYKAFNDGTMVPTQARSAMTTTPTPLEEFAKTFAAVYQKN